MTVNPSLAHCAPRFLVTAARCPVYIHRSKRHETSYRIHMRLRTPLVASATLIAMAACSRAPKEDPRLDRLTVGMSREVALRVLGDSTSTDSLANIYRREMYLFNGQPLEILFFSPQGLREGQGPVAAESTLRPVVLNLSGVSGWGWTYFDSVARVNGIKARVR